MEHINAYFNYLTLPNVASAISVENVLLHTSEEYLFCFSAIDF